MPFNSVTTAPAAPVEANLAPVIFSGPDCRQLPREVIESQPSRLVIGPCPALEEVSTLSGLADVEDLRFIDCPNLENFDSLATPPRIQTLRLRNLPGLVDISIFREISSLKQIQCFRDIEQADHIRAVRPELDVQTIPN